MALQTRTTSHSQHLNYGDLTRSGRNLTRNNTEIALLYRHITTTTSTIKTANKLRGGPANANDAALPPAGITPQNRHHAANRTSRISTPTLITIIPPIGAIKINLVKSQPNFNGKYGNKHQQPIHIAQPNCATNTHATRQPILQFHTWHASSKTHKWTKTSCENNETQRTLFFGGIARSIKRYIPCTFGPREGGYPWIS